MIDTKQHTQELTTAHSVIRSRAGAVLDKHLEDLAINAQAVENAQANRATFDTMLQANQQRRAELLAALTRAQTEMVKAQAAHGLSVGTPVEEERAEKLEQARGQVSSVHLALQELAAQDEETRARREKNETALEIATEQLRLVQETVDSARANYDEFDTLHRDEISKRMIETLYQARQKREKARAQLEKAEAEANKAQEALAAALSPWAGYARSVLAEHAEITPNADILAMEEMERWIDVIEDHFSALSQETRAILERVAIPWNFYNYYREATVRKTQRSDAALPPGQKKGHDRNLWPYAKALEELDAMLANTIQAHRKRTIERLVVDSAKQG